MKQLPNHIHSKSILQKIFFKNEQRKASKLITAEHDGQRTSAADVAVRQGSAPKRTFRRLSCNVPEPNPKLASPVTERKNKFSSSRKFFWSEGAGLAMHPLKHNQPSSETNWLGARAFTSVRESSMRLALLLGGVQASFLANLNLFHSYQL